MESKGVGETRKFSGKGNSGREGRKEGGPGEDPGSGGVMLFNARKMRVLLLLLLLHPAYL